MHRAVVHLTSKYVQRNVIRRPLSLMSYSFQSSFSMTPSSAKSQVSSFCTSVKNENSESAEEVEENESATKEEPAVTSLLSSLLDSSEHARYEKITTREAYFLKEEFERVANQCLANNDIVGFKDRLEKMKSVALDMYHYKKLAQDVQVSAMHYCAKHKHYGVAYDIASEMIEKGYQMNPVTAAALLMTMRLNKKYQEYVDIFEVMEEKGQSTSDSAMTGTMDGFEMRLTGTYLDILNKLGEFEKTLQWFGQVKKRDRSAYRIALLACTKMKQQTEAKYGKDPSEENETSFNYYTDLHKAIREALNANKYD